MKNIGFLSYANMESILRLSHILQLITAEYEKRGIYLPILHEAMCDNYFIVKCLFKENV